jgi:hypothetical protein
VRGGSFAALLCTALTAVYAAGATASTTHARGAGGATGNTTRSGGALGATTSTTHADDASATTGNTTRSGGALGATASTTHADGASATASAPATGRTTSTALPSALVVFLSPGRAPAGSSESDVVEHELASIPTLSTGILSATQGSYTTAQMVLDITQGARVSSSAYKAAQPPFLTLPIPGTRAAAQATSAGAELPAGARPGSGGLGGGEASAAAPSQVEGWPAALARADSAPQLLDPGLLAAQIPGGAAYLPAAGVEAVDGVIAANRSGRVATVAVAAGTLAGSIDRLRAHHRLVVADLPVGSAGYADLRALAASRPPNELLIVVQRVPDEPNNAGAGQAGNELLWIGLAGVGGGGRTLTSQTTNQRGLVAAIDIGPTILRRLDLPIPADMRGRPIATDGALDRARLRELRSRLLVIGSRRLPAAEWLVAFWALLLAATRRLDTWRSRKSPNRARGGRPAPGAWAMRTGALAMLWTPVAVLLPAALEPTRDVELAMLVAVCFAFGALTDRLVRWPRAPLVPAVAAVLALTIDALAGTQLLMRSLLGPTPAFGARFYGIGNELKSGLAVLVFTAVAAALYPAVRSRRAATTMACAGVLLAVVEGSARIGAGVGGVILVSAGTAVATVMLLPGTLDRKRVLIVMAAPVVGLAALAALDLATAHGSGHFTGSVLDARSTGDIRDIVVRRYGAAWDELKNHLMPFATVIALTASAIAVRRREQICAPVASDPAWVAALAGGLAAGVIGALSEDSGPVLLVVAVFALGCVLSYLWGSPIVQPAPGVQPLSRTSRATAKPTLPVAFE